METTSSEQKREEKPKSAIAGAGPGVQGSARAGFFVLCSHLGCPSPTGSPDPLVLRLKHEGESPARAPEHQDWSETSPPSPNLPQNQSSLALLLPRRERSFLPRLREDLGRISPPTLTSRLHRGWQDVLSGRQGDEESKGDQPEAEGEVGQDLQAEHRALRQ